MHIIYCLQNKSLKDTILSIGIASSAANLKKILKNINKTYLPTPYTLFLSKNVQNPKRIERLYSLLSTFGKRINRNFFEIPAVTVKELFDIIDIEEEFVVVQCGAEYLIPKANDMPNANDMPRANNMPKVECIYSYPNISDIVNDIENTYDRLSYPKNYSDLDL